MGTEELMRAVMRPPYILVTKPGCTYCSLAKDLLRENDIEFQEVDHKDCKAVKIFAPEAKSYPVIFRAGHESIEYVGGFMELSDELGGWTDGNL